MLVFLLMKLMLLKSQFKSSIVGIPTNVANFYDVIDFTDVDAVFLLGLIIPPILFTDRL